MLQKTLKYIAVLACGVLAVSTSAPLIAAMVVPPLAISFWRNGFATLALVPGAGRRHDEIEQIRSEVSEYLAECAEKALASPMPDPERALEGVFADTWEPLGDGQAPWSHWQGQDGHSRNGSSNGAAS